MSNHRFNIENNEQLEMHFRLLSITDSKYENDWNSYMHTHRYTEIFYIKNGKGHMQIENEIFPISANSLVIISPQVLHTEYSDPTDPLDYYVLGVDCLKLNMKNKDEFLHLREPSSAPFICQCFENIHREMQDKKEGYAHICQHYLAILILYFSRKNNISYEVANNSNSGHEFHKIKRFIDYNYQDKITLDSLAKNCSFSKFYLSHRFCELYGKSPIAYLNDVRLSAAKDLLLSTNLSIEEIASSIGFSSACYLSQSFRKKYNMSPNHFRKNNGHT